MIIKPRNSTWLQISLGAPILGLLLICGLSEATPNPQNERPPEIAVAPSVNSDDGTNAIPFVRDTHDPFGSPEILPIDMNIVKKTTIKGLVWGIENTHVPDAKVILVPGLYKKPPLVKTVDRNGEFEFTVDRNGNEPLHLTAVSSDGKKTGYVYLTEPDLIRNNEASSARKVGERFLVRLNDSGAMVKGMLKDVRGNSVPDAVVRGDAFRAITAEDGSFEMYYMYIQPRMVYSIVPGKGLAFAGRFAVKGKSGDDSGNPFSRPIELILYGADPLSIQVTDSDGKPLPGCKLRPQIRKKFENGNSLDLELPMEYVTDDKGIMQADWVPDCEAFEVTFDVIPPPELISIPEGTYTAGTINTRNRPEGKPIIFAMPRLTTTTLVVENPFAENGGAVMPHININIGRRWLNPETGKFENKSRFEYALIGAAGEKYRITFPPHSRPGVVSPAVVDGTIGEEDEERVFRLEKGIPLRVRLFDTAGNPVDWSQNANVSLLAPVVDERSGSLWYLHPENLSYGTGERDSWPKNEFRSYLPRGNFELHVNAIEQFPQQSIRQSNSAQVVRPKEIKDPVRKFTAKDQPEIVLDFQIDFLNGERSSSNRIWPVAPEVLDESQDIRISLRKIYQSDELYFDRLRLGPLCNEKDALAILERELKTGRYKTLFLDDGDKRAFGKDDPASGLMSGVRDLAKKYGLEIEFHGARGSFGPDEDEVRKKAAEREIFPAEIGVDIPHRSAFLSKGGTDGDKNKRLYDVLLRTSMNANTIEEREALARIADEVAKGKRRRIILDCDKEVPYEKVLAFLEKLKRNGIPVYMSVGE